MDRSYNTQSNFYENSNAMLDKRTFEFANYKPIMIMDNNKLLEQHNAYNNNSNYTKFNNNKNVGEITGDLFDISAIDKGMPLRSNCGYSKKKNLEDEKGYNRFTDFDVFDEDKQVNLDISYYDPDGGKACVFDEMNERNIIVNSEPIDQMSYIMNDFNWYMFENIKNLMNENIFFSSYGIMSLMTILYMASTGKSENLLLNYFNFSEKQTMYNGLNQLIENINKSQCFDLKNFILVGNNNNINNNFTRYINNMVTVINLQNNNPIGESQKINMWINNLYQGLLGNIMNPNHIKNLTVTCLCIGILRTVWKVPFEKIIKLVFNNVSQKEFLYNNGKTYDYYEDNLVQLIELPLYDDILTMGIVLPKSNQDTSLPNLTLKDFDLYTSNLKSINIDEIAIPKFNQHSKIRISSIFKKTGLDNIFTNIEIPELIKNGTTISDVIQNIYLIVENKYIKTNNQSDNFHYRGAKSNIKFIANKPFIYYFRCLKTNTIIITGQFK